MAEQENQNLNTLEFGLTEIERMVSELYLPESAHEMVDELYRIVVDWQVIGGHSIDSISSALVYFVCREKRYPVSLREIETVSRVERAEIYRVYSYLCDEFGRDKRESIDPKKFVPRYCSQLKLGKMVELKSMEIIDAIAHRDVTFEDGPTGYAGVAIYAAASLCEQERTKEEVAAVSDVSANRIESLYRKITNIANLEQSESY